MSRYKAGYSERHSPFYDAGLADGQADAQRVMAGEDLQGQDEDKAWSAMYRRGYADGLAGSEQAAG
jgi:hypothetical protein